MVMQMKGASVDGSNSAAFGNVTGYNNCGNYEIETIKSVVGNTVEFTFALVRDYDASGGVQLVSIPEYQIASVDSALKPIVWTGTKGGVIILKADTIILNDSVNVKGYGFRGGAIINDSSAQPCYNNGVGGASVYYCANISCGAAKGQGIGTAGFGFGRGKDGNGAGGGNDHNTGGGGGANFGSGGMGGTRTNTSTFSCPGPYAGIGGSALSYSNGANKIFMGGGGGAGDENNNEGTEGGHGGGIVIFMANTLVGNNKRINANANSEVYLARADGAGGGGGAGTVLLYVDNYSGNVQVYACGGKGGNLDNGGSQTFCMGPGGGGGGGMLWVKTNTIPSNITYIDTGGLNGKDTYGLGPAACPFGTTNGATAGTNGGSLTGLNIVSGTIPFVKLSLTACCDTTVCPNQSIRMTEADTSTYPATVSWSNGSSAHTFTQAVAVTTPFTITVTDHRGCQLTETHTATVYNNIAGVTTCCDTTVCPGATASFNVSAPPLSQLTYHWSTGDFTTSITQQISTSQTFYITITDQNGCSIQQSVDAFIDNTFPNLSICCDTVLCSPSTVIFTASTTASPVNYAWSSGQNTATITPTISSSQSFTVTVSNTSGCSAQLSVNASINNVPPVFTVCCDTVFCTTGTILAAAKSDSILSYHWSTGETVASISHSVSAAQTFTVTATNANGCSAQQSVNASIQNIPPVFAVCCDTAFCVSGTLKAVATSANQLSYSWSNGASTDSIFMFINTSQAIGVQATDALGCTAEAFVDAIILNTPPSFSICCDTVICPNGTVNLAITTPPNGFYTYNWNNGQQSPSISQQLAASQTFSVTVTDQNGCSGLASSQATVNNTAFDFSVCCDTVLCLGEQAVFTASSTNQATYSWSSGETTASISPTISTPQTFTVTATNAGGCTGAKGVQASISSPTTSITAVPDTTIQSGQTAQLFATGDSTYTYLWSSSETLDSSNSKNPTAKPISTTIYCVTATDKYGCTATACYKVEINLPDIKVPDAFSPNGDGHNDVFTIFPLSSDILEIRIYNRWGEVVFYSKGNAAWDGTYKGKTQEAGNFVCQISYTNPVNPGKTNTVIKDLILVR